MKAFVHVLRAPVFFLSLAVSIMLALFFFAWVSMGAWCEDVLRWFGCGIRLRWLPGVLGFVGYVGLGLIGPIYLGEWLIGWPGAVLAPVFALGVIALLGRW